LRKRWGISSVLAAACTGEDALPIGGATDTAPTVLPSCGAAERTCVGAELRECDEERTGFTKTIAVCTTAALCEKGRSAGACAPAACNPGQSECRGRDRYTCADDLGGSRAVRRLRSRREVTG